MAVNGFYSSPFDSLHRTIALLLLLQLWRRHLDGQTQEEVHDGVVEPLLILQQVHVPFFQHGPLEAQPEPLLMRPRDSTQGLGTMERDALLSTRGTAQPRFESGQCLHGCARSSFENRCVCVCVCVCACVNADF